MAYEDYLIAKEKHDAIFKDIVSTAKNLCDAMHENQIYTCKDMLKMLIREKKIGAWYISGKISKHFLAAIPNFNKIIPRLDQFSKVDLEEIERLYVVLNNEANEAWMIRRSIKLNPMKLVDEMFAKQKV